MRKILKVSLGLVAASVLLFVGIYFLFPEALLKLAVKAGRYYAGLVKKEIQVDDHKIVYLEGGKGQTILLLHGFGANKDSWMPFAKFLTGDYHLVIPDIPGFGESSQIEKASYDAENELKRIDRFTEVMKLDRFHLAGNSMGGMLAAMYGAAYPRKVSTLALLAPAGVGSPNPSEVVRLIKKGTNPLLIHTADDFDQLLRLCYVKPPYIPSRLKKALVAEVVAQAEFNKKIWGDMKWTPTEETASSVENFLVPYLPQIQAPVLIIWGDGDKILDVGGVAVLEKNVKNYQTVIMKQTGHIPQLEKPQETASYYMSYLKGKK
jgi:pimeloyl-ACP methyl ester carboxylesterase